MKPLLLSLVLLFSATSAFAKEERGKEEIYASCLGKGGGYYDEVVNYIQAEFKQGSVLVTWYASEEEAAADRVLSQAEYEFVDVDESVMFGYNRIVGKFKEGVTPWDRSTPFVFLDVPLAGAHSGEADIAFVDARYGHSWYGYIAIGCGRPAHL